MKALLALLAALLFGAPAFADPQSSMPGTRPHNGMETLSRLNIKQMIAPLTGDGCILCLQDSALTGFQVYKPMYAAGALQYDGIRSVLAIASGKSYNMDAFGAYVQNNNAFVGGFGAGVGYFAMANAAVDNARVWGGAFVVSDSNQVTVTGVGAGRQIIGLELDMSTMNTSSVVQGIAMLGSSRANPTSAAAYSVGQLDSQAGAAVGSVARWTSGFNCADGVVMVNLSSSCVLIGVNESAGTNIASQYLVFGYRDGASLRKFYYLNVDGSGNFNITDNSTGHSTILNTALSTGANAISGGAISGSTFASTGGYNNSSNFAAVFPTSGTTTSYWTNNFANGPREVDIWNADTAATSSLRVYQKTGASAATLVMEVDPKGYLVGNGATEAAFTVTTNVTPASITGLSQSLVAAGKYSCDGHLHFTTAPTTANGVKLQLATSDTLTVTTLNFNAIGFNGAAFATTGTGTATALGATAIASTNVFSDIILNAQIVVNAAGTLQLQIAENASSVTIAGNARWNCQRAA